MATIRSQFTDEELAEIRAATQEAEQKTGGELVCVIVQRCDSYEVTTWTATALGAVTGSLLATLWLTFVEPWGPGLVPWVLLPPVLGAAIALVTVWALPGWSRWLIPDAVLQRRVDRRAAQAFLEEEVFDTRDRTGLMLFVALYEHAIRVLCDTGIADRVPQESWESIVAELSRSLKRGTKGPAIATAVRACGQILAEHRIPRRDDDEDELDNEPRLLDA